MVDSPKLTGQQTACLRGLLRESGGKVAVEVFDVLGEENSMETHLKKT